MAIQDFQIKLSALPEKVKAFFLSDNPMLEMKKAFVIYGVNSALSKNITQETAQFFFVDLSLEQLPQIISQKIQVAPPVAFGIAYEMTKRLFYPFSDYYNNAGQLLEQWRNKKAHPVILDDIKAYEKVMDLEPWIKEMREEEKRREMEESVEIEIENQVYQGNNNSEKMPLKEALKNIPELGDQLITGEKIKIHSFTEPIRPSLKNWLSDYTFNLGFEYHDAMVRGNFLFQNENAKKLSASDRQKLSYFLRAYDENAAVDIDRSIKEIVLPRLNIESLNINQPKTTPVYSASNYKIVTPQPSQPSWNKIKQQARANEITPQKNSVSGLGTITDLKNAPLKSPANRESFPNVPSGQDVKIAPFVAEPKKISTAFGNKSKTDFFAKKPAQTIIPVPKSFEPRAEKTSPPVASQSNLSFSSPQKLPNEKPNYSPNRIIPFSKNVTTQNTRSVDKNVVNLKDMTDNA